MAAAANLSYRCFCILLMAISYHRVLGDVTLQASASQSHPMEGHSTELTCEVRSMNQSQVVVWSKDQMSITWGSSMGQMMSSRFELSMDKMNENLTKYELTINDINRDDDGRYQCQVLQVNGMGYSAMASDTVVLSVLYFPTSSYPYCSVNGSRTLLSGEQMTVTCISESGNPQINSRWSVAGGLHAPLHYQTVESSNMVMSELELTASHSLQGVTYVCQVTSPAYPEIYRSCSLGPLRILDWPIVNITRSASRVPEGADVHFLCNTEPVMPNLRWITNPEIEPERLDISDDGSLLTVKNVRASDNATNVVCQVSYRDAIVEARSVILVDDSTVNVTSELCLPWFGAFIFTVIINLILCVIIVRLLVKNRKLVSKLRAVTRGASSMKDLKMAPKKGDPGVDPVMWPTTLTNWSMRSEAQLQRQRHRSWQYIPDEDIPAPTEIRTYTELSPDTTDASKVQRKQTRNEVSSPDSSFKDSAPYVTPNTRSKLKQDPRKDSKAVSPVPVKATRKTATASANHKMRKNTTKSSSHQKGKDIKTVSGQVSTNQEEIGSYMDLNESTIDSVTQRSAYQPLKKTSNTSRYAAKAAAASVPSSKRSRKTDKDDMAGDSGIYGEGESYMKYGKDAAPAVKYDNSLPTDAQDMTGESASYMPTGIVQSIHDSASAKRQHSESMNSGSGTDGARYESPPDSHVYSTGSTDDGMGDAIYAKSTSIRKGDKQPSRGQPRATVSSRPPMPKPTDKGRKDSDPLSTDESYKDPYPDKDGDGRTYFTLEPDQGSYHNYGADISSENDSYQGPGSFDWDPADKGAASKKLAPSDLQASYNSDASYLELADPEGEIKGYMDMTKNKPIQTKASSKVNKPSQLDSDASSNEYYQQMKSDNEYSVPSSNKARSVIEKGSHPGTSTSEEKTNLSSPNKQKKKSGWVLFRK